MTAPMLSLREKVTCRKDKAGGGRGGKINTSPFRLYVDAYSVIISDGQNAGLIIKMGSFFFLIIPLSNCKL